MIEELQQEQGFPVVPMCRILGVSKSGYYVWKNRKPSARKLEDERYKLAIKAAHERGRGTYGTERFRRSWPRSKKSRLASTGSNGCGGN